MGIRDWIERRRSGGFDLEELHLRLQDDYSRHLEDLELGPSLWLTDQSEELIVATRIYEQVRTSLIAAERGDAELPDPAPEATRRFIALEEGDYQEDWSDPGEFANANSVAVSIGAMIRKAEGADAAPISDAFRQAIGNELRSGPADAAPQLRRLAEWGQEYDETTHEHLGTDPLLLSLVAPGDEVWKALEWWSDEYVRLKTMSTPGIGVVMDRTKAIRFGYLLACYLELEDEDDSSSAVSHS